MKDAEDAIEKLKEAVDSFEEVRQTESDIYSKPLSIKELHEFLTVESKEPLSEPYELRCVRILSKLSKLTV
jgi:hypothetical protein